MILALDLATTSGFCFGRGDTLPTVGHVKLPKTGDEVGPYLCAFDNWLAAIVDRVEPELVVFESPVLNRRRDHPGVTRKLHALPGVVEMLCWRRAIEVREAKPMTIKKQLTGDGHADKNRMCAFARAYGLEIKVADEADAFGVWLVSIRARRPLYARLWDFIPFRGPPANDNTSIPANDNTSGAA